MRQPPLRLHCQINLCRAKEPQAEYAITLRQPRFSIDPPPRLGKFGASRARRVALEVEGVVNGGVHAEQTLGGASRLEPRAAHPRPYIKKQLDHQSAARSVRRALAAASASQ